jgi:hypothetical protein
MNKKILKMITCTKTMYFSLFPLETYDGIYKSFEARSERAKKKKFYTISLVDISVKGGNGKSHSGRFLLSTQLSSVQVSIF